MIPRNEILKRLRAQINVNGHIIGTVAGSGMTARYSAMGGADLLLALSAGKFRIMGRSSFSSYLCYGDSNTIVMDMGCNELLPIIKDTPVLLLDDVLSELDKHRQNYLLDSIHDIQTLITCTGLDEFVNHRFSINKVFHVQNGHVSKEN